MSLEDIRGLDTSVQVMRVTLVLKNNPSMRKQWARGGPCPPRGFWTIDGRGYIKNIDDQLKSYERARDEGVESAKDGWS